MDGNWSVVSHKRLVVCLEEKITGRVTQSLTSRLFDAFNSFVNHSCNTRILVHETGWGTPIFDVFV